MGFPREHRPRIRLGALLLGSVCLCPALSGEGVSPVGESMGTELGGACNVIGPVGLAPLRISVNLRDDSR